MKIGNVEIKGKAVLAPMAGVADRVYRLMCREYGAAYTVSEMVSAKGICYSDKKTAELCTITEGERPMGIQLFGYEADFMAEAVKITDGNALLEASGNVTAENIHAIAETGVDIISLGALTHSVKCFDISMKIKK